MQRAALARAVSEPSKVEAANPAAGELPTVLDDDGAARFRTRQLDRILAHSAVAAVLATGFAWLIAVFMEPVFGALLVHAWFAAKVLSAAPRFALALAYKNPRARATIQKRGSILYWTLALDGIIWGLAGLASARAPAEAASALVACLAVVAAVATLGLQVRLLATAIFVTPLLVLSVVGLLLRLDGLGAFASAGLALLIVQLWVSGYATEKRLRREFLSREQLSHSLQIQSDTAKRLEETSDQLRRQSAVKSMFLGTMSHELRTPLHGILGVTSMMRRDHGDADSAYRLGIIQAQGEHLLGLISALLDVSRIETGRLELHPATFDLAVEVRQLADLYTERTSATAIAFVLDGRIPQHCWVTGDAARVRQVLHNLLGNAVKFTKRGWIKFSVARGDAGETVFTVADTGLGIPLAEQSAVFEAFRQAGEATQREAGTGLGLTIARELAHAMGGDVTLESVVGVGSKFEFRALLPAADAPLVEESSATAADRPPRTFAGYRVLMAEDNDVNAFIAEALLRHNGVEVARATGGLEAVKAAMDKQRPHLVLMDLHMPDLDGLAATVEIRRQEKEARISQVPIVAMTANSSREDMATCEAAGMNGFLSKPFSDTELARVLADHLGPGIPTLGDENDDLGSGGYEAQPPLVGRSGTIH
jgi:signal transduction histidine kinase/ActR/RegA family two-component response regulator